MERFRILTPVVFAAFLALVAWASMAFTVGDWAIAAVWPANAIIVAFLIRWARTPAERAFVLVASAGALLVANLVVDTSVPMAISLILIDLLEVGLCFWILRRAANPMSSLRAFSIFLGGAVLLAPALTGFLAAGLCAVFEHGVDALQVWLRKFLADALGMGIAGSFLLTVGRPFARRPTRQDLLRFLGAQTLVVAASVQVLLLAEAPALFMIYPFLVAAAMSQAQIGGVTSVGIASIFGVVGGLLGSGPAAVAGLVGVDPIQVMQVFLVSMVFTVLPVSALLQRLDIYGAELEERRSKAEELNQIKTKLLAQVSHEIRSPIAGVTTLAELMRDGALGDLTPSQRETMEQIVASGAQVTDLARDLTDAAAIQTGKATVEVSRVPVALAIRSAVETARFRGDQYRGSIEIICGAADGLTVAADPLRLRQILVNLLVNGCKYGGQPPLVRIGARLAEDGMIRFEVSDNGPGITPERRGKLFKDFERLGAEKTDLDGAGLGLALSQQMAALQNGRIGVEDGDLGGARFWLDLPIWKAAASAA